MTSKTKNNILLVDDDRLVLATFALGLNAVGYNVNTAESVDDAEAILASGERPDLAIIDVNMPGKNGLKLAERLRSFDYIPFMLLTAYSDQKIVEHAANLGALGYLVKPVDFPHLIPAIEAALARASELRGLRSVTQQLQTVLDGERDISIATGIIMVQYRLSRKAAFDSLRNAARSQRRKLAEVAGDIICARETLNLSDQ